MRRRLAACLALFALVQVVPPAAGQQQPMPVNVGEISRYDEDAPGRAQRDTQAEPDVAVDPTDPQRVMAVFQQGRFPDGGSSAPGFATSQDGGVTWTSASLPGVTTENGGSFPRASDPVAAYGPDGAAYAQTLLVDLDKCHSAIGVSRSDDGGLTFDPPVIVQEDIDCDVFNDKNWMTVDNNPASPHLGRLYSVWTRNSGFRSPIVLVYSDDRGDTWSDLIQVSPDGTRGLGVIAVARPDGSVVVGYIRFGTGSGSQMVSQTSIDGGETFGDPVVISKNRGYSPQGLRAPELPSLAVDPVTGTLYFAWQDARFDHNLDILLSSSATGATWSKPVRVNPDTKRVVHATPDVAAHSGAVHAIYLTRRVARGGGPSRFAHERYVVSTDGGATFSDEVTLGPRINLKYAARVVGGIKFLGDYTGIVATPLVAYAVWPRSRPDGPDPGRRDQRTWAATIPR